MIANFIDNNKYTCGNYIQHKFLKKLKKKLMVNFEADIATPSWRIKYSANSKTLLLMIHIHSPPLGKAGGEI